MKLSDAMGTKYITNGNAPMLRDLLRTTRAQTLDLVGCKITGDIASIIEMEPLRFVDTGNPERESILAINREAAMNREKLGPSTTLPKMGDMGPTEYLLSLDPNQVYDIISSADMPITAFVLTMRPDLKIAIGAYTAEFGQYIARKLYAGDVDKFIEVAGIETHFSLYERSKVSNLTVKIDGSTVMLSTGEAIPLREILISKTLIPQRFGVERINHLPVYSEFIQNVYKDASLKPVQELTLYDILTEEAQDD
jgi:hypothetical protein